MAGCGGASIGRPEHTAVDPNEGSGMRLTSDAFRNATRIPTRYTCDGDGVSPPLAMADLPAGAVALALVVDDPDAPRGTWDHWVAYDIPLLDAIPEAVADLGTPGANSWGGPGYGAPCPPGGGSHRYFFTVYALDARLGLDPGATKATVLGAMQGHVLDEATLVGIYSR